MRSINKIILNCILVLLGENNICMYVHILFSPNKTRMQFKIILLKRNIIWKNSSTDSDWDSSLPPIQEPQEVDHVMGPVVQPLISPAALFPPISAANSRNQ